MILEAKNLSLKIKGKVIVSDVSLEVNKGEFLGIIGPNGSGKTSIMSLLSGIRRPSTGAVFLKGKPLKKIKSNKIAREIALVQQQAETTDNITARQVVELGRIPHLSAFEKWSPEDDAIVQDALEKTDMTDFVERSWNTLSGGEKQRLHFARALAQQPSILLLDEPSNHLDIEHQLSLLHFVRAQNLTVVAAMHDLNQAALFCDRIAVIHKRRIAMIGTPRQVLTPKLISTVFNVDASIDNFDQGILHIRFRSFNHKT